MGDQQIEPYNAAIEKAQDQFQALAQQVSGLDFNREAMFATQALVGNQFLAKVANNNPDSVRMAVINVAAVGLTLNPAQGLAYLVPRDGRVLLDISYRGLIRIAMDEGAIQAAKAELVYEQDQFRYRGPFKEPDHECDPFAEDRGKRRGVYCVARLPDGGVMTEVMSEQDIQAVMQTSESAIKGKGPWVSFPGEMAKKAVVKRAAKWWQTGGKERLSEAVRILNEDNGEGFSQETASAPQGSGGQVFEHEPEPETPDPSRVGASTQAKIAELCRRATRSGQWSAAEEYIEQRYHGNDLAYAREQLLQAQLDAQAASEADGGAPDVGNTPSESDAPEPEPMTGTDA